MNRWQRVGRAVARSAGLVHTELGVMTGKLFGLDRQQLGFGADTALAVPPAEQDRLHQPDSAESATKRRWRKFKKSFNRVFGLQVPHPNGRRQAPAETPVLDQWLQQAQQARQEKQPKAPVAATEVVPPATATTTPDVVPSFEVPSVPKPAVESPGEQGKSATVYSVEANADRVQSPTVEPPKTVMPTVNRPMLRDLEPAVLYNQSTQSDQVVNRVVPAATHERLQARLAAAERRRNTMTAVAVLAGAAYFYKRHTHKVAQAEAEQRHAVDQRTIQNQQQRINNLQTAVNRQSVETTINQNNVVSETTINSASIVPVERRQVAVPTVFDALNTSVNTAESKQSTQSHNVEKTIMVAIPLHHKAEGILLPSRLDRRYQTATLPPTEQPRATAQLLESNTALSAQPKRNRANRVENLPPTVTTKQLEQALQAVPAHIAEALPPEPSSYKKPEVSLPIQQQVAEVDRAPRAIINDQANERQTAMPVIPTKTFGRLRMAVPASAAAANEAIRAVTKKVESIASPSELQRFLRSREVTRLFPQESLRRIREVWQQQTAERLTRRRRTAGAMAGQGAAFATSTSAHSNDPDISGITNQKPKATAVAGSQPPPSDRQQQVAWVSLIVLIAGLIAAAAWTLQR